MAHINKTDKGKTKFNTIEINKLFRGASSETTRSSGLHKPYGLQCLGKVGVSRRMPPPAHLPSIKSQTAEMSGALSSGHASTPYSHPINAVSSISTAKPKGWVAGKDEVKLSTSLPSTSRPLPTSSSQIPSDRDVSSNSKNLTGSFQDDFPVLTTVSVTTTTTLVMSTGDEGGKKDEGGAIATFGLSLRPQNLSSWREGGSRVGTKATVDSLEDQSLSKNPEGLLSKTDQEIISPPSGGDGIKVDSSRGMSDSTRVYGSYYMGSRAPLRNPPMRFDPPPFRTSSYSSNRMSYSAQHNNHPSFLGRPSTFPRSDMRFRMRMPSVDGSSGNNKGAPHHHRGQWEQRKVVKGAAIKDFDKLVDGDWGNKEDDQIDYSRKLRFSDDEDKTDSDDGDRMYGGGKKAPKKGYPPSTEVKLPHRSEYKKDDTHKRTNASHESFTDSLYDDKHHYKYGASKPTRWHTEVQNNIYKNHYDKQPYQTNSPHYNENEGMYQTRDFSYQPTTDNKREYDKGKMVGKQIDYFDVDDEDCQDDDDDAKDDISPNTPPPTTTGGDKTATDISAYNITCKTTYSTTTANSIKIALSTSSTNPANLVNYSKNTSYSSAMPMPQAATSSAAPTSICSGVTTATSTATKTWADSMEEELGLLDMPAVYDERKGGDDKRIMGGNNGSSVVNINGEIKLLKRNDYDYSRDFNKDYSKDYNKDYSKDYVKDFSKDYGGVRYKNKYETKKDYYAYPYKKPDSDYNYYNDDKVYKPKSTYKSYHPTNDNDLKKFKENDVDGFKGDKRDDKVDEYMKSKLTTTTIKRDNYYILTSKDSTTSRLTKVSDGAWIESQSTVISSKNGGQGDGVDTTKETKNVWNKDKVMVSSDYKCYDYQSKLSTDKHKVTSTSYSSSSFQPTHNTTSSKENDGVMNVWSNRQKENSKSSLISQIIYSSSSSSLSSATNFSTSTLLYSSTITTTPSIVHTNRQEAPKNPWIHNKKADSFGDLLVESAVFTNSNLKNDLPNNYQQTQTLPSSSSSTSLISSSTLATTTTSNTINTPKTIITSDQTIVTDAYNNKKHIKKPPYLMELTIATPPLRFLRNSQLLSRDDIVELGLDPDEEDDGVVEGDEWKSKKSAIVTAAATTVKKAPKSYLSNREFKVYHNLEQTTDKAYLDDKKKPKRNIYDSRKPWSARLKRDVCEPTDVAPDVPGEEWTTASESSDVANGTSKTYHKDVEDKRNRSDKSKQQSSQQPQPPSSQQQQRPNKHTANNNKNANTSSNKGSYTNKDNNEQQFKTDTTSSYTSKSSSSTAKTQRGRYGKKADDKGEVMYNASLSKVDSKSSDKNRHDKRKQTKTDTTLSTNNKGIHPSSSSSSSSATTTTTTTTSSTHNQSNAAASNTNDKLCPKVEREKKDPMAGIDVNNYASVVIVDNVPEVSIDDPSFLFEKNEGFQEVTSRRTMRIKNKAAQYEEAVKKSQLKSTAGEKTAGSTHHHAAPTYNNTSGAAVPSGKNKTEKEAANKLKQPTTVAEKSRFNKTTISAPALANQSANRYNKALKDPANKRAAFSNVLASNQITPISNSSIINPPKVADEPTSISQIILPKIENWNNDMAKSIPTTTTTSSHHFHHPSSDPSFIHPSTIDAPITKTSTGFSIADSNDFSKQKGFMYNFTVGEWNNKDGLDNGIQQENEDGTARQQKLQQQQQKTSQSLFIPPSISLWSDTKPQQLMDQLNTPRSQQSIQQHLIQQLNLHETNKNESLLPSKATSSSEFPIQSTISASLSSSSSASSSAAMNNHLLSTKNEDRAVKKPDMPACNLQLQQQQHMQHIQQLQQQMAFGSDLQSRLFKYNPNNEENLAFKYETHLPPSVEAAETTSKIDAVLKNKMAANNSYNDATGGVVSNYSNAAEAEDDPAFKITQVKNVWEREPVFHGNHPTTTSISEKLEQKTASSYLTNLPSAGIEPVTLASSKSTITYQDSMVAVGGYKDEDFMGTEQPNVCKVKPQQQTSVTINQFSGVTSPPTQQATQLMIAFGQGSYAFGSPQFIPTDCGIGVPFGQHYGFNLGTAQTSQTPMITPLITSQPSLLFGHNDIYNNQYRNLFNMQQQPSTIIASSVNSSLITTAIKQHSQTQLNQFNDWTSGSKQPTNQLATFQYGQLIGNSSLVPQPSQFSFQYDTFAPSAPNDPSVMPGNNSQIVGSHLLSQRNTGFQGMPSSTYYTQTLMQQSCFQQQQAQQRSASHLAQGSYQPQYQLPTAPLNFLQSVSIANPSQGGLAAVMNYQSQHALPSNQSQLKHSAPPFKPSSQKPSNLPSSNNKIQALLNTNTNNNKGTLAFQLQQEQLNNALLPSNSSSSSSSFYHTNNGFNAYNTNIYNNNNKNNNSNSNTYNHQSVLNQYQFFNQHLHQLQQQQQQQQQPANNANKNATSISTLFSSQNYFSANNNIEPHDKQQQLQLKSNDINLSYSASQATQLDNKGYQQSFYQQQQQTAFQQQSTQQQQQQRYQASKSYLQQHTSSIFSEHFNKNNNPSTFSAPHPFFNKHFSSKSSAATISTSQPTSTTTVTTTAIITSTITITSSSASGIASTTTTSQMTSAAANPTSIHSATTTTSSYKTIATTKTTKQPTTTTAKPTTSTSATKLKTPYFNNNNNINNNFNKWPHDNIFHPYNQSVHSPFKLAQFLRSPALDRFGHMPRPIMPNNNFNSNRHLFKPRPDFQTPRSVLSTTSTTASTTTDNTIINNNTSNSATNNNSIKIDSTSNIKNDEERKRVMNQVRDFFNPDNKPAPKLPANLSTINKTSFSKFSLTTTKPDNPNNLAKDIADSTASANATTSTISTATAASSSVVSDNAVTDTNTQSDANADTTTAITTTATTASK